MASHKKQKGPQAAEKGQGVTQCNLMPVQFFWRRHQYEGTDMEKYGKTLRREDSGFSLIELLIYMALLGILMTMVFSTFIPVMRSGSRQWRIGETKIETGVGMDLLRADLEHAGFGLPWTFPVGVTPNPYLEPAAAIPPGAPAALADAPTNNVPRALVSEDASAFSLNGSDYLAIKAINVTLGATSQKWGWLSRNTNHTALVQSLSDDAFDSAQDRVIVIRPEVSPGVNRQLVLDGTSYFAYPKSLDLTPFAPPETPQDPNGQRYLVYGLDNTDPRRPFNRTDYYISGANVSAHCAPGTGNLVKATLNQANDNFTTLPIVDCVADFQVVYYLDKNGDGGSDTKTDANGLNGLTAQQVREQVKSIRCYILTHEGGVDPTYRYPNANITVGEVSDLDGVTLQAGRVFDVSTLPGIGAAWANYRWKVYSLAVTPRNLQ